jgi:hypothetical protein
MVARLARTRLALLLACFLLPLSMTACAHEDQTPSGPASPDGSPAFTSDETEVTATPFALPTLLPTTTTVAEPTAIATRTPAPTTEPEATIDFQQPVVELRYRIPALALDRRLEGNVNGQITVVDETRGVAAIRQNQGGVLLELQGLLPALDLEPLPDGCDTCVAMSFSMPLEPAEGEGWLQDPVLLASVENYTAALLGPHFPPNTLLGLRRSATAYDVAHSLALDADGMLYRWLATAGAVDEPLPVSSVAPDIPGLLDELQPADLQDQYTVDCRATPVEALYFGVAENDADGEEARTIRLVCPAFSLPRALLPLYVQLDRVMQETLEGSGLPRPPSEIALDAVLDYRREDGAHLTLTWDGIARITRSASQTQTSTVTTTTTTAITRTIGATQVMSITTMLLDSGTLQPGLEAYVAAELENILLVRGDAGMLEVAWAPGQQPQAIRDGLAFLNELLEME